MVTNKRLDETLFPLQNSQIFALSPIIYRKAVSGVKVIVRILTSRQNYIQNVSQNTL